MNINDIPQTISSASEQNESSTDLDLHLIPSEIPLSGDLLTNQHSSKMSICCTKHQPSIDQLDVIIEGNHCADREFINLHPHLDVMKQEYLSQTSLLQIKNAFLLKIGSHWSLPRRVSSMAGKLIYGHHLQWL